MISDSIKQHRFMREQQRKSSSQRQTAQRKLGLAVRNADTVSQSMQQAARRVKQPTEKKYDPAESINSWMEELESIQRERLESVSERSTSGTLTTDPLANPRPRSRSGDHLVQKLVERGMPAHIAQGFVMNFRDESGFDPGINEIEPVVPGSRGGFGLYQLTGPRRVQYEEYAQSKGLPFEDEDAQLDWLMMELEGSESRAAEKIYQTSTPGEAAAAIVRHFLRPAEEHRESRAARYLSLSN